MNISLRCVLLGAAFGMASAAHAESNAGGTSLSLISKVSSDKAQNFNDFLLKDGAFEVAASGLVGISPNAITTVENTRDVSVYLKAFSSDNKGGGFSITPARTKSPFPRFSMADYVQPGPSGYAVRAVAAATWSYAQATTEIDTKSYRRRATALSTNFYLQPSTNDPIWVGLQKGSECGAATIDAFKMGSFNPPVAPTKKMPDPEAEQAKQAAEVKELLEARMDRCIQPALDELARRWFRPLVSVVVGTGDIQQDQPGGASARLGTLTALSLRYGQPLGGGAKADAGAAPAADFAYGWALTLSGRWGRGEPVISSIGSAALIKRDTSLTAARLALGSESARLLAEVSNAKSRQAELGEAAMQRAIGLEYRLGKAAWLHFRYGSRVADANGQRERASLLSLSLNPEAFDVTSWFK